MTFTSPFSTSISLSYCEETNDFRSEMGQRTNPLTREVLAARSGGYVFGGNYLNEHR